MFDVVTRPLETVAPTSDTSARIRAGRGGSGANIAVAVAATGHDVLYVGVVGDDAVGRLVIEDLEHAGVRHCLQVVSGSTGVVVAIVAPDGQRAMLTDRGVNAELQLAHVVAALGEPFEHLHVSGYTLLDERTRAIGEAALARARVEGWRTSVDVCSVAPLRQVTPRAFLRAAALATMLFANEEEALALSEVDDAEQALAALAARFDELVVTRGGAGVVARRGEKEWSEPPHDTDVLDTTGAGDAATGAYLGARLSGDDVPTSLERAMAAAATVVRGLGARG